jgi:hypothetical protein
MAEAFELLDSADNTSTDKGQGGDHAKQYGVTNCSDQATAEALVRSVAPLAVSSGLEILVRQKLKSKPEGLDFWKVQVEYGPEDDPQSQQPPQPGTWKFDFDTTGATHLVTSAPLFARYGSSSFGPAPDLQGAINYDEHSKQVKGVELPVANGKFSITQYVDARQVTPNLMRTFQRLTPRTNSDTWLGFEAGEVIYLGTKGQGDIPLVAGQRVQPIGLVHHFDASENRDNGFDIEGIDTNGKFGPASGTPGQPVATQIKLGWHYLWVWFKRRQEEDFSKVVPRPAYAYVHAPFRTMSFGQVFGFS